MCSSDLNSEEVSKVLRHCHDKSWKFGRSDFQVTRGGASSYVSSYVNSLSAAPLLYRSCRAFKPRQRASLGFFEKGEAFEECEDIYHAIEKKSILSLMDESITSTGLVLNQLPPCRISVPYCPDSRVLAMTMLLRLLELFELLQARQKEWQDLAL